MADQNNLSLERSRGSRGGPEAEGEELLFQNKIDAVSALEKSDRHGKNRSGTRSGSGEDLQGAPSRVKDAQSTWETRLRCGRKPTTSLFRRRSGLRGEGGRHVDKLDPKSVTGPKLAVGKKEKRRELGAVSTEKRRNLQSDMFVQAQRLNYLVTNKCHPIVIGAAGGVKKGRDR